MSKMAFFNPKLAFFDPANPALEIPRDSIPHKKCGIRNPAGLFATIGTGMPVFARARPKSKIKLGQCPCPPVARTIARGHARFENGHYLFILKL